MESSRFEGAEREKERCFELETLFFVGEGDPKEARAVKIEREREREGGQVDKNRSCYRANKLIEVAKVQNVVLRNSHKTILCQCELYA